MKKTLRLLFLLLVMTMVLTGCQKKYDGCINACESNFTNITPTGITNDYKVTGTVKQKGLGYNECIQNCIKKYK